LSDEKSTDHEDETESGGDLDLDSDTNDSTCHWEGHNDHTPKSMKLIGIPQEQGQIGIGSKGEVHIVSTLFTVVPLLSPQAAVGSSSLLDIPPLDLDIVQRSVPKASVTGQTLVSCEQVQGLGMRGGLQSQGPAGEWKG
jgi:hypothetical protein